MRTGDAGFAHSTHAVQLVSYLRVSTAKQGTSGLGLEAQRVKAAFEGLDHLVNVAMPIAFGVKPRDDQTDAG